MTIKKSTLEKGASRRKIEEKGRSLKDGKLTQTPTQLSFSTEVGNIDFRFSYNITSKQ